MSGGLLQAPVTMQGPFPRMSGGLLPHCRALVVCKIAPREVSLCSSPCDCHNAAQAVRQLDLPPDQEVKVADGLCSNAFQVLVKCLNASRRHASRAEQQLSMPFVDLRAVLQNRNSSSSTTNNCTQSAGTQIGWDLFVSSTSEHVKSGSNRGAHMACISRMRDTQDNMKWTD